MRLFTVFIIVFLLSQSLLISQNPIILSQEDTLFYIDSECSIKVNEPQDVTIDKVLTDTTFKHSPNENIIMGGKKPKNIWLKFSVNNSKIDNAYLELMFPLIDKAELYTVDKNNNIIDIQKSGQNKPFQERVLHTNSITFNLKKSDSTHYTYYLKVKARWICNIKPRIGTYKSILQAHHYSDLLQGIFLGVIFFLILYNFFVYLKLKDNVYLFYSLYLFCGSMFVIRHQGLTVEFIFSASPHLNDYTLILPSLTGIFGMLFTMRFLNTRQEFPLIHKGLILSAILYTLSGMAAIFHFFELSLLSAHLIMPFSTIIVITSAIMTWQRGDTTAKYYLLGWATLTLCLTIFLLENSGVIMHNNFLEYALPLGFGLEAIILSYAIAHKFGLIKIQQEKTQANILEMFRLSQEMIQQQNRLLEQKVEERTQELQKVIEKVHLKEEELKEYALQLENSNKELTEFAHIASHDLKAPLRSILSFAQLFERRNKDKFDETDREYFNFIKSNAAQSANLIEDLLNYSKIDKNLGEPVLVDVNKCLAVAEMNIQSLIREKNANIQYDNLPILRGHTSLITHLFQNLINNGIKYNKNAQPTIHVRVQKNEKNECVFSVSDDGIGIAPENYEKIFAMFRRLHAQTEYDGTGIGLSFCTRIVETYGGKIWLESQINKGTTFYFTLPKAKMTALEMAA